VATIPKLALLAALLATAIGVGTWLAIDADRPGVTNRVTFTRDVAPIVFNHCSICHRPGESAPFDLLTYDDVADRAEQIVDVVDRGFMPPWLPDAGHGDFVDNRRLSETQIATLTRWVEEGAAEGDVDDLPELPQWTEGWQLGKPDLIITMPEAYTLPADVKGTDKYRSFVIPIPGNQVRNVRAVELRPGNKKVVHHANMFLDRARSTRRLDAKDPGPGFDGMELGEANYPDGHFLGWTPGNTPDAGTPGITWRLDPGSDLLLQLHMVPIGKPETIQASVGFYFDDGPQSPLRSHTILMKADEQLQIPAGDGSFTVSDSFTLPVDAQAIVVYPHAHYLGKTVDASARLPDGSVIPIIRISNWDFNWQDSYRYSKPVELPKGTELSMTWTFDNTADNVQNPNSPPQLVKYGNRSTDEMSHLYLQLLLRSDRDVTLVKHAQYQQRTERFPGDWEAHSRLGRTLESLGQQQAAIRAYHRSLEIKPDYAVALQCLAQAHESKGDLKKAGDYLQRAVQANPNNVRAHHRLAHFHQQHGRLEDSVAQYRAALEADADFVESLNNLAWIFATSVDQRLRNPDEAVKLAERASKLVEHRDIETLDTLATAYAAAGRFDDATKTATRALELAQKAGNAAAAARIQESLNRFRNDLPIEPQ